MARTLGVVTNLQRRITRLGAPSTVYETVGRGASFMPQFTYEPDGAGYRVIRDGVALGHVEQIEVTETVRRANSATLRKVRRWKFRRVGGPRHCFLYATRKAAVAGLVLVYDRADASRQKEEG